MSKVCVFCEVQPGGSQEHAFPTWFISAWANLAKQHGLDPNPHYSLTHDDEGVIREFDAPLTVGGICASCNTGWMSMLESRVKPIVLDLIMLKPRAVSESDQRNLARWAMMKSLVFVLATPNTSVPQSRYRHLYRGELGPASIRLMTCVQLVEGSLTVRSLTSHRSSFQAVFRMGWSAIHVLGHAITPVDDPTVRAETDRRSLQLWPPSATVQFPPEVPVGANELSRLTRV